MDHNLFIDISHEKRLELLSIHKATVRNYLNRSDLPLETKTIINRIYKCIVNEQNIEQNYFLTIKEFLIKMLKNEL